MVVFLIYPSGNNPDRMNQLLKDSTITNYEVLAKNLEKLLLVQNASEIFNLIGKGLEETIPQSIIIINQVTQGETIVTTKGVYGLKENLFYNAIEKLGLNPIGRSYTLNPELLELYKINNLHKIEQGLSKFSNKAFPTLILNEIEKLLNIKQIYTTGLRKQGKLFAIIHIFKREKSEIENIELIQQLLNQFSLVLQNKLYQIELEQKEKALQQALSETGSSYIIWNSETNTLDFSKKILDQLGFLQTELSTDINQWEKLVHPDDKTSTLKKISRFFKERVSFKTEYRIRTKEDRYKWFEATFKMNDSNHNNQNEVLIVHTDIDDSKKAEIALLKSRNRFQKLANLTNEGIIIHREGICMDVNNALLEITGLSKNELIGKEFAPLILCKEGQSNLLEIQENEPYVLCASNTNGKKYYIEVSNRSLDEIHEVFTIRNISELKEKEFELKAKNEKLNEVIQLKNKFLKIISHDLKNPFFSINGIIDLLIQNIEKYPIDKTKRLIKSVSEEGHHAYNLLESLLLWSHKEDGNLELQIQTVNLESEVSEIVMQHRPQVGRKSIILTHNIPPETYIKADIQLLRAILRNLLGNAIKYTSRKSKIEIDCTYESDLIKINVKNQGDPISNEAINRILNKDYLNSKVGTEAEQGSGFGLSIVKDLIALHNSSLYIESTKDFNIFSFSLKKAL